MSRYSRQELFAGIGVQGQERLRAARVLVVGVGALGSTLAELMVRAGVGAVTVVDRDFVEESNLQRQALFEQADADQRLPKAVAAERHLRRLNPDVRVEGLVADVHSGNVAELVSRADLVLDGTDNFETRFVLNDACVRAGVPWVYGACVGAYGLALAVRPRQTPCLKCLLEELPPPASSPTCDTVGVIAPIARVVAGIQAAEALKLAAGRVEALLPGIVTVDLWKGSFEVTDLSRRRPSCPACTQGRFDDLERPSSGAAVLCGGEAVQIRSAGAARPDLEALAARLGAVAEVKANEYLVHFTVDGAEIVVFADGRALIKGVADEARARALYARYVGS
jgi:adenylyltransferase/sulfurtransferase